MKFKFTRDYQLFTKAQAGLIVEQQLQASKYCLTMLTDGDLQALWLTVRLAVIVTFILLLIGTPISWWLARCRWYCRPQWPSGAVD